MTIIRIMHVLSTYKAFVKFDQSRVVPYRTTISKTKLIFFDLSGMIFGGFGDLFGGYFWMTFGVLRYVYYSIIWPTIARQRALCNLMQSFDRPYILVALYRSSKGLR